MSEAPDIVQNAREFIRQRDTHRDSLRAELKLARERVREIEGLLAELGADTGGSTTTAGRVTPRSLTERVQTGAIPGAKKMKIPALISAVVAAHPKGMGVGDIVKAVIEAKEGRKCPGPQTVYATVYRMRDSGRLGHTGETPNVVYTPPAKEAAAE